MIQVTTNNEILIDGQPTGLSVTQAAHGTVVYSPEKRLYDGRGRDIGQQKYLEHKMPHLRYSLAHDAPASGVAGKGQFEADIRELLKSL